MLERSILIPILLVVVIGAPIVYHEMEGRKGNTQTENDQGIEGLDPSSETSEDAQAFPTEFQSSQPCLQPRSRNLSTKTQSVPVTQPFLQAGFSPTNPVVNPTSSNQTPEQLGMQPVVIPRGNSKEPAPQSANLHAIPSTPVISSWNETSQPLGFAVPGHQPVAVPMVPPNSAPLSLDQFTPDYGKSEQLILPGNEHGPDWNAEPLEFLPVADFREIFRFDLTKLDVQRRWKRISTNPADLQNDLNGMRVPLVTGTNSWDLHGSLTYFFDRHQQLQRITFRGWTGDPQKLVQLLINEFQYQAQPTGLAGFYLSKSKRKTLGGLLIKTPSVIDSRNPLQQFAMVLEINRTDGNYELSEDFRALISGSHSQ